MVTQRRARPREFRARARMFHCKARQRGPVATRRSGLLLTCAFVVATAICYAEIEGLIVVTSSHDKELLAVV